MSNNSFCYVYFVYLDSATTGSPKKTVPLIVGCFVTFLQVFYDKMNTVPFSVSIRRKKNGDTFLRT